jgi:hypothetical protein
MPYPTPSSKEAFEAAWNEIYSQQPYDIKLLIKKVKDDPAFTCREIEQFVKNVIRKAEYVPTEEEIIAMATKDKLEKQTKKDK